MLRRALEQFGGVKRRFTRVGEAGGIAVIDDYGHHPVEIAAVLAAARTATEHRVIAVVQPHRYSRLKNLFEEFCTAFNDADAVIVADVYPAGEAPIEGVNRDALVEGLRAHGHRQVLPLAGPADTGRDGGRHRRPGRHGGLPGRRLDHELGRRSAGRAREAPGQRQARQRGHRMMPARKPVWDLVDRLPAVRGRYVENAPLAPYTWFRVGGPAEVLFRPADRDDLAAFLAGRPDDVPVTVLGSGSNALVRDGGIPGVVVRLDRPFANIEIMGERVRAGAMALGIKVALTACDAGVAGWSSCPACPARLAARCA